MHNCDDCKDTGEILLLFSTVPCDCVGVGDESSELKRYDGNIEPPLTIEQINEDILRLMEGRFNIKSYRELSRECYFISYVFDLNFPHSRDRFRHNYINPAVTSFNAPPNNTYNCDVSFRYNPASMRWRFTIRLAQVSESSG